MTNQMTPIPGHTASGQLTPDTMLTLSEIADLLGRDIKTVKNWRADGRWPNAVQETTGRKTWHVPASELVASGDLDPSQLAQVQDELAARRESREVRALREQLVRLEEQLTAAHSLAEERAATVAFLKTLVRKGGAA